MRNCFTRGSARAATLWSCAALLAVTTAVRADSARQQQQPSLDQIYATLAAKRFVDLTHAFGPATPHWKGFGEMKVRRLYTIAKAGFNVDEFCHVGQWGTHVDPPAHFHEGLKTVDQIDPKDMLMPLVVLDVHEKVASAVSPLQGTRQPIQTRASPRPGTTTTWSPMCWEPTITRSRCWPIWTRCRRPARWSW